MTVTLTVLVLPGSDDAALSDTRASFDAQGTGPWELVETADGGAGVETSVSTTLNRAAADALGNYIAVVEAGDRLEPGALAAVALTVNQNGRPAVLYTDEQWPAEGSEGIFTKPDWIPRYLEAYPYLGRLCFVRRDVLEAVGGWCKDVTGPVTEWDLALRVTETTDDVVHVPVLGVSRVGSPPMAGHLDAGRRVVSERYKRLGLQASVEGVDNCDGLGSLRVWRQIPRPVPLVTLVVPTAGGRRTVRGEDTILVLNALASLVARTTYENWDVVIVANADTDPAVLDACGEILGNRLQSVVWLDGPFNFSRSVNAGVGSADGSLVVLLNDDTEVLEPRWLERMVSVAQDPTVGVVGAKLLFEDGRIQHTGITFDARSKPVHVHIFEADNGGHFGSKVVDLDYLAVTGACLLVSRDLYGEVGGFTHSLPLNFNDVDFCLKVVAAGRRVVCTPFARLRHFESSTRTAQIESFEYDALAWWRPRTLADPHVQVRGLV